MLTLRKWFSSLIVLVVTVVPVMAGNNDAKPANGNAANARTGCGPGKSEPVATNLVVRRSGNANVAALLGVLVTKGSAWDRRRPMPSGMRLPRLNFSYWWKRSAARAC